MQDLPVENLNWWRNERLEAYDHNTNFGAADVSGPEYQMEVPACTDYRDLHSDSRVPPLTRMDISSYFADMNKELDAKAVSLYENNYVNFIRCSEQSRGTFFKAEVRAERKAHVVYIVDTLISSDSVVIEAQCECAAGMGPHAHCKHVGCVLYGLTDFVVSRGFKTVLTCTQQLQTFHQAKQHLGSPVKAELLKLHVKEEIDFDPRPAKFRKQEGYGSFFRSVILNSGVFQKAPIMHTIMPANPYAFNLDHDYLQLQQSDIFLHDFSLVDVTPAQIQVVEIETQRGGKKWKRERCKRICSSSFGKVCKATERTDHTALANTLILNKNCRSKATAHGKTYKRVAVRKYEHLTGRMTSVCGLHICEAHPYLCSTPDRRVNDNLLLEVKCPYTSRNMTISQDTVPYLECNSNGDLSLKRNHDYFYQVQGQMLCTKSVTAVDFVIFTFKDLKVIHIQRDDAFIQSMLSRLQDFHRDYHRPAVLETYFYKNYSAYFC